MAIAKRIVIEDIKVERDGQVVVFEHLEHWEGGFLNGVLELSGPRTGRVIDVGDNVSNEEQIVKDTVQNLHTPKRIAARQKFKREQEEREI